MILSCSQCLRFGEGFRALETAVFLSAVVSRRERYAMNLRAFVHINNVKNNQFLTQQIMEV